MGLNFENLYGSNTFGYTAMYPARAFLTTISTDLLERAPRKIYLLKLAISRPAATTSMSMYALI
jgi:hypothetical protein